MGRRARRGGLILLFGGLCACIDGAEAPVVPLVGVPESVMSSWSDPPPTTPRAAAQRTRLQTPRCGSHAALRGLQ